MFSGFSDAEIGHAGFRLNFAAVAYNKARLRVVSYLLPVVGSHLLRITYDRNELAYKFGRLRAAIATDAQPTDNHNGDLLIYILTIITL